MGVRAPGYAKGACGVAGNGMPEASWIERSRVKEQDDGYYLKDHPRYHKYASS